MSVEERLLYGPGLRHHPASLDGLNKLLTICFWQVSSGRVRTIFQPMAVAAHVPLFHLSASASNRLMLLQPQHGLYCWKSWQPWYCTQKWRSDLKGLGPIRPIWLLPIIPVSPAKLPGNDGGRACRNASPRDTRFIDAKAFISLAIRSTYIQYRSMYEAWDIDNNSMLLPIFLEGNFLKSE